MDLGAISRSRRRSVRPTFADANGDALHLVLQVLVEQRELVAYSRKLAHSRQPSDDPDDCAWEQQQVVTSKMMHAVAWLPAGGSRLLA